MKFLWVPWRYQNVLTLYSHSCSLGRKTEIHSLTHPVLPDYTFKKVLYFFLPKYTFYTFFVLFLAIDTFFILFFLWCENFFNNFTQMQIIENVFQYSTCFYETFNIYWYLIKFVLVLFTHSNACVQLLLLFWN